MTKYVCKMTNMPEKYHKLHLDGHFSLKQKSPAPWTVFCIICTFCLYSRELATYELRLRVRNLIKIKS